MTVKQSEISYKELVYNRIIKYFWGSLFTFLFVIEKSRIPQQSLWGRT